MACPISCLSGHRTFKTMAQNLRENIEGPLLYILVESRQGSRQICLERYVLSGLWEGCRKGTSEVEMKNEACLPFLETPMYLDDRSDGPGRLCFDSCCK